MLRRVEANDAEYRSLQLYWLGFVSNDAGDYSRLGAAIGNNTHLETLAVAPSMMNAHWIFQMKNSSMASNVIHLSVTWNLVAIGTHSLEE